MALSTLTEVIKFFGFSGAAEFRAEWSKMTEQDRKDLRAGIGDGSLTY